VETYEVVVKNRGLPLLPLSLAIVVVVLASVL
jgi:hypothetical protein